MKWVVTCALFLGLAGVARCAQPETVEFRVKDIDGKSYAAADSGAEASVWVFLAHDCPICNAYGPELNRIVTDYTRRGVRVHFVFSETGLSVTALRAHAAEYLLKAPLVLDGDFRIAVACGATSTPEAAVIDSRSRLVYRGRIDDRFEGLGSERAQVQSHSLRDALDAILAGREIAQPRTLAVGCALELPLKAPPDKP